MRRIVLPGDMVAEDRVRMENTYFRDGKTFASVLGILDDERGSVISLEGAWKPKSGSEVVGIIRSVDRKTCSIELNHSAPGILIPDRNSRYSPKVGDVVESIIARVERRNVPIMERARPVADGARVIHVKPSKIPRILGKNNSMLRQIEEVTGARISVGVNGIIAISGDNTDDAIYAIRLIEENAHTSGLTDRVRDVLTERVSGH